jgi:hypothetical protein
MNCGAGIYGILINDSTLCNMLSNTTAIFSDLAPQRTLNPCIVFSESVGEFSDDHDGVSDLDINVVQVDVYANTVTERVNVSNRVRTLLDRYSGTINGIVIQSIQLIFSNPTIEPYKEENNKTIYRQSMDYKVRQLN